ncbi:MAG: hypothetical protein VKJ64_21205, partial [Leptolyngbyaceae bacterium]|nr:hypothetical protein [Leptolyngbyaceae bacterium]
DYRDNPGYQEQRDDYGPNAQNDGGVAEGEPQEQFIFDYGDEAALDEFEATLDQSKVGQYRWQRPAVKRKTEDEAPEARSTVDEDLEALNDWDDWEEDSAAPRDAGGTNGSDVDAPRPIREVQRHPIATQKSGSIYSFSYRQEDVGEADPSPAEDSSQDIPAAAEPTPAAGQTSDPDSTTVTGTPDLPPDSPS